MTALPVAVDFDLLDGSLQQVEQHLLGLGHALRDRNSDGIELSAARLHAALARAIDLFTEAASQGRVPDHLRLRLARASAQVAAHREALARATAALDRAIDVLIPRDARSISYGATGRRDRPSLGSVAA